ncbi:hypothetical protein ASE36_02420 [Rhizobium sp. Root274]|uniref:hypothetical protein n=1 Tax=unclassified Rhizobium TaxID=2613769 RepID=UPI0007131F11|nr:MULTISPECIES: hypothetical protein [unclassified Rhizobium]KQW32273.1 hypothetical protein ASC71_02415 [Rhizobium sp. Root1240]KRD33814.1 hypothetical protein ASE36_02420 [Rhizobium sp. Root274]
MLDAEDGLDALPPVIEVKALGAGADLEGLLAEFTTEMRAQFELFRRLRESAESLLDGSDEGTAKLARADLKAATDAIALIVRTLEKIDTLLRQLERDRLDAEERQLEARDPEVLRAEVEALIAARVEAAVARQVAEAAGSAGGQGP